MCARRRCNCARVSAATEGREECSLTHTIAMRTAHGTHQGDFGRGAAQYSDSDGVPIPITRFAVVDQVRRLGGVTHEVQRDEYLDAVFLDVLSAFGVRAGEECAAVLEQDGLRVVEAVDGAAGQDCEAGIEGRSGVVKGRRCDSGS